MTAAVRLDNEVFSDPRIDLLGQLAGYNRHEALGRIALLWSICTDKQTAVVSEAIVRACVGNLDALIGSELGERVEGGIRVKGLVGRMEWLGKKRSANPSGTHKGPTRDPQGTHKGPTKRSRATHGGTQEDPTEGSQAPPLPLPLPIPEQGEQEIHSLPGEQSSSARTRAKAKGTQLADGWVPERSEPNLAAESAAKARGVDLRNELLSMRDWAAAKGEIAKDWNARWRNWTRKATPQRAGSSGQSGLAAVLEFVRNAEEEAS